MTGMPPSSAPRAGREIPLWILALSTTFGMQTVASFLSQSLPIIAPLLTAGVGLAPERVGNLSSLNSLGSVIFLLFCGPLLARLGPVRMLQVGAAVAAVGLAVAASGWGAALMVAALLLGLGYGPSPPAGSRILSATSPKEHRSLIFSIKQAGAPAGGALAGLILAPIASAWGWTVALIVPIAVAVMSCLIIEPTRARLDTEREPNQPIGLSVLFDPRIVVAPFLLLKSNSLMLSVTALAFSLAIVQGCLFSFSVTYLVIDRQMPLVVAGMVYACLQFAGVFARIFLGWLADRTGRPTYNLTAQAFIASGVMVVYAMLPVDPPVLIAALIATAAGFFGASWNGIYMAEVARLSPAGKVSEATSSSTIVTFMGYVLGPSIFSVLVTWTGGYRLPFLFTAVQLTLMAVIQVFVLVRRARSAR